jgi:arylsulfatase A-like enzyme
VGVASRRGAGTLSAVGLLVLGLAIGCDAGSAWHPDASTVILLTSWDTTRADAIGAYGDPRARTPNADALAARGVRFEWALTQAPSTLNAHTTLFTGLDAHRHGVVRNGYPLEGNPTLLAERFAAAGWDTIAVIGGTVLDHSLGLARGFRIYDDVPTTERVYEHDAKRVTDRALAAIDKRDKTKPLFLFVHYYDAHSPWNSAPKALQREMLGDYQGPVDGRQQTITQMTRVLQSGQRLDPRDALAARELYLAEVSWVDENAGRLLVALRDQFTQRLVALVADHGEVLDEYAHVHPYSHGEDVDLVAIHIPFILWGTPAFHLPGGAVIHRQVRLMDVGTTLAGIVGLDAIGEGENLSRLWKGTDLIDESAFPAPPSFAEATKPAEQEKTTGWNNLPFERGVARDGHLWIEAPLLQDQPPQLYALVTGQTPSTDATLSQALHDLIVKWDAAAPPFRPNALSPAQVEALRALGYVQ